MTGFIEVREVINNEGEPKGKYRLAYSPSKDGHYTPLCWHDHESHTMAQECPKAQKVAELLHGKTR